MNKPKFFRTTIGGVKMLVGAINLNDDGNALPPAPKKTHRILVLDRSYSMAYYLENLIAQVKHVVKIMPSTDLLSVLWFSGPGDQGVAVSGCAPSADIQRALDALRRPIGSTCFSEVLNSALAPIERFAGEVDQTIVDLFTDGQPVVPWGAEKERELAVSAVNTMVGKGVIAFNTVGYGPYYNRDFLNQMSGLSEYGVLTHTAKIEDFFATVEHNMSVSGTLVKKSASIHSITGSDILYVSPGNSAKLSRDRLELSRIDANVNWIFVVVPEAGSAGKHLTVNENSFLIEKPTEADDVTKENFLYAYASELWRKGDQLKAVDILASNLRDKGLAAKAYNAFTTEEIGETQNAITAAMHDKTKRWLDGKTGPGFMPAKNAMCVMDVFDAMIKSPDTAYYLPLSSGTDPYTRIGRKVEEAETRFTADVYEVRAAVDDLVWSSEKLNLSIRFQRTGHVNLLATSAANVNMPATFHSFIWRNHTFVKDGNVNIKRAAFLLPEALFEDLKARGVKYEIYPTEKTIPLPYPVSADGKLLLDGKVYVRAVLDLGKLPIINRSYIDQSNQNDDLHQATSGIIQAEASHRALDYLYKKVVDTNATMKKEGVFAKLTKDQIRVLEEHGVNKDGSYGGIKPTTKTVGESDSYEARFITFTLKGCSNLPSIPDMEAMIAGKKKLNLPGEYMITTWKQIHFKINGKGWNLEKPTTELRDFLKEQVKVNKQNLNSLRNTLNMLKLAKVLTGDGFKDIPVNDKGDLEYTPTAHPAETMLIKLARKQVAIDAAS